MKVSLKVVLRDLWVGVYISPWQAGEGHWRVQRTYVCLIPCLPIVIERRRSRIPVAGDSLGAMTPEIKDFYKKELLRVDEKSRKALFEALPRIDAALAEYDTFGPRIEWRRWTPKDQ